MKVEIPIRHIEDSKPYDRWPTGQKWELPEEPTTEDIKENISTKEINTTLTSIVIKALIIFLTWFIGWAIIINTMVDQWLQKWFEIIKLKTNENKQISHQINVLNQKITTNSWLIENAKKTIKTKYNIEVK